MRKLPHWHTCRPLVSQVGGAGLFTLAATNVRMLRMSERINVVVDVRRATCFVRRVGVVKNRADDCGAS